MKTYVIKVMIFTIVFCAGLVLSYLMVQAWTGWNNLEVTTDDTLTAEKWNEMITQIENNSGLGMPSGAIMAFSGDTCPSGWTLADGNNGTIDLRGVFLRGKDGGRGLDPDGDRAIGDYQDDAIQTHTHGITLRRRSTEFGGQAAGMVGNGEIINYTNGVQAPQSARTAIETRGKNVAVLFCVKQ